MYQRSHPTQRHSHHTSKMNRGAEHLLSISQRSDFSDLSELTCQNCQDCKATIKSLQKNLEMRDEELAKRIEQIVGLEEKIVQMSLELASSKAFEDEHRAKRRVSSSCVGEDEIACSNSSRVGKKKQHQKARRASSMDTCKGGTSLAATAVCRKSWWRCSEETLPLPMMLWMNHHKSVMAERRQ